MDSPQQNRTALIAEASAWLARLDTGSADPARFDAWRDAHPAHAAAFAEVAGAWSALDGLRGPGVAATPRPAAWSRRRLMQAAGIAGLGLASAAVWAGTMSRAVAETRVGERRLLRLKDGSALELNTDTRVSWRFSDRIREVSLERGEAALTVSPDHRPFRLKAGAAEAALAPGEYNARRRGEGVDVLVTRGRLAAGARTALPGQAMLATATTTAVRTSTPSEARVIGAWKRGEIIFEGQPLASAVDEYNRYLDRKIVIADPSVGAMRFGGRFTTTDARPFLNALHDSLGIRAVDAGGETIVLTTEK